MVAPGQVRPPTRATCNEWAGGLDVKGASTRDLCPREGGSKGQKSRGRKSGSRVAALALPPNGQEIGQCTNVQVHCQNAWRPNKKTYPKNLCPIGPIGVRGAILTQGRWSEYPCPGPLIERPHICEYVYIYIYIIYIRAVQLEPKWLRTLCPQGWPCRSRRRNSGRPPE